MDFSRLNPERVMDYIQDRLDELRRRRQNVTGTVAAAAVVARIAELIHLRFTFQVMTQEAQREADAKLAEPRPYPTLETHDRMYRDAVQVQDACNLSGVVSAFARHMHTLCEMGLDTDQRNRHPVSVLFSSKIASLTGSEVLTSFHDAYEQAKGAIKMFEAYRETHGDEAMQEPQREDVGVQG